MRFSIMRTFARLSAAVFTVCRGIVSICSLSNCAPSSSIMVAVLLLLLAVNERGAGSNELAQVGSGRYTCCWCGGGGAGGTRAVTSVSSSRMVDGGVVEGGVVALRLANSTNAKGAAACSYSLHLLVLVWLGLGSVVIHTGGRCSARASRTTGGGGSTGRRRLLRLNPWRTLLLLLEDVVRPLLRV